MPGVGVRTARASWSRSVTPARFPTAGHLAAYAGLAPVTRRSGSSIRGEHPTRGGNKRLKNALFMSAFAVTTHGPRLPGLLRPQTSRRARSTTPP